MSRLSLLLPIAVCFALFTVVPRVAHAEVELSVIDRESGDWLAEYPYRGDIWISGHPGHRYGIRLHNRSGDRVMAVLSVDGINAVSGQTAHPSQTGYILGPWQQIRIDGWRKSLDEVAGFVFTDFPDSYAARTARPDNVGVIGIAVYNEADQRRYIDSYSQERQEQGQAKPGRPDSARAAAAGSTAAREMERGAYANDSAPQSLGTGHGRREWSPATHAEFVRAGRPSQVTELRYDDDAGLVARGVVPRRPFWQYRDAPRSFPGDFVADPPWN